MTEDISRSSPDRAAGVDQLVEHLFRHEVGRMVSRLARILGTRRLALAEDAVQYSMLQALQAWGYQGVPENPQAWLARVAYNRALDLLRRERKLRFYDDEKEIELRRKIDALQTAKIGAPFRFPQEVRDERLSLIFVCCHPALPRAASVALTLKVVCGFGVQEIARALLSTESTVSQKLVRAKRMIREQEIPFKIPDPKSLPERLGTVLEVLYLLFTEGYAASAGNQLVKNDLCAEAIRLAESLTENQVTARPECHALLALMLFQAARLSARIDAAGDLLLLEDQDRSLWDRVMIDRGLAHLAQSADGDFLSTYHLQAEIAAIHCSAETFTLTNWKQILALYDLLAATQPTPVVLINRAVAVAQVHGPGAALEALKSIVFEGPRERYPFLDAAEGEFFRRLGRFDEADRALRRALDSARTDPERRFIERKLSSLNQ